MILTFRVEDGCVMMMLFSDIVSVTNPVKHIMFKISISNVNSIKYHKTILHDG